MTVRKKIFTWSNCGQLLTYTALGLLVVINLFPFYWAALTAFKKPQDILKIPPVFFTTDLTLAHFQRIFVERFDLFYMNSIIQVILSVVGALFFSTLGGFIFAKFEFRGKETLFKGILSTMMLPFAVLLIPMVVTAGKLHLINNMAGLVVPYLVVPFGVFLMRQFMETIPNELLDAARIDGASNWQIYRLVMIPLSGPAISTLAIFFFLANWNRFLWPLVTVYTPERWTLPVAASAYTDQQFFEYGPSSAAATLMMVPLVFVFIFFQRGITRGIALTGMKG